MSAPSCDREALPYPWGEAALDTLRILEIGEFFLFKRVLPEATTLLFTGPNPVHVAGLGAEMFALNRLKSVRDLVQGERFDLVVAYPPAFSPWSPRQAWRLLRRDRHRALSSVQRVWGSRLAAAARAPLALLDMGDAPVIYPHNSGLLDRCRFYFKRELPPDFSRLFPHASAPTLLSARERTTVLHRSRLDKLRPIGLGLPPEVLARVPEPLPEKTSDVFFAGLVDGSSEVRRRGLAELRALESEGVSVDAPAERLPVKDYLDRVARARLTWSPEGYGWDCRRTYEAAACGSVPLVNRPTIHRHAPFRDGEHCFQYDVEEGGLTRAIRWALSDEARLARMGAAARRHMLQHHTHRRMCAYIVETCLRPSEPTR